MGVEPDQADALAALGVVAGQAGDGAHGDRVVAAQHQRQAAVLEHRPDRVAQPLAGAADLAQVPEPRVAGVVGLGDLDVHVAGVVDLVPQVADVVVDVGQAEGRGAHVDATAPGPQVERHADHGHLALLEHRDAIVAAGPAVVNAALPARPGRV